MSDNSIAFGPFVFDRDRLSLKRDGEHVSLGGRGAALLKTLLDADGALVGKEALLEAAWPGTIVEESNLTVQIALLRKALGTRLDGQEWIVTVPRVGYRLPRGEASPVAAAESAAGPLLSGRPSIAVLPFSNLSSDPQQDFVADGVVEDLITALSRFHTFAVVSRSSSFVYKGRAVDIREVAKELGVRYLLEGSVRRSGDRIRVTAQLIAGTTGEHVWAEKFDGMATDIFDFQDKITDTVIGLIEPQIRKAEIERVRSKRPERLDAWDLYVQALPLVHSGSVANYSRAVELLDRAVALDPSYAPAIALAAWAHEKRHTFGGPDRPEYKVDGATAIELAERAVAADSDDALALALLGWLRILFSHDYSGLELVRHAVALNPNNISVLDFAAVAYIYGGELDEVIAICTRALSLSPGSPNRFAFVSHIGLAHSMAGRYAEAVEFGQRAVELEPNYFYGHLHLAISYAQIGRIEEARQEVAAARRIRPDITIASETNQGMRYPERHKLWLDGLRKAGVPEE
jgi:TolB-like protein/tetratricopeptide (TPR) repeat protein